MLRSRSYLVINVKSGESWESGESGFQTVDFCILSNVSHPCKVVFEKVYDEVCLCLGPSGVSL